MCLTIIPLAGPDFYSAKFGIRPLFPVGNSTLIEHVLANRPWISKSNETNSQLVFVLREEPPHSNTMTKFIFERYPTAEVVTVGRLTAGAPLSALAGLSLAKDDNTPIIIDLADIAFDLRLDLVEYFQTKQDVDAIVPYFRSSDPKYSYLKLSENNVIETREKTVISDHASAGVYCFRNVSTYLRALSYCMKNENICKIGSAFFVCPSVNGLIGFDRRVHGIEVTNAQPIGRIFHGNILGAPHEI